MQGVILLAVDDQGVMAPEVLWRLSSSASPIAWRFGSSEKSAGDSFRKGVASASMGAISSSRVLRTAPAYAAVGIT